MGVYRVAVCDDERAACEEVCRLCDDILTQDGIPHRIVPFASASALDACLREGDDAFDLLVLDIAMRGQSGMELAHELRRRRDRVSIVFVTGCEEYLEEGYGVQPVHFLLKPVTRERLSEALHADRELNHSPKTVTLQRGGGGCCGSPCRTSTTWKPASSTTSRLSRRPTRTCFRHRCPIWSRRCPPSSSSAATRAIW